MTAAIDKVRANRGVVAGAIGLGVAAAATYYLIRRRSRSVVPKSGPFLAATLPEGAFDAVIVGSGPSGSTCAYYLAKAGARVALLDKETFPRDKYCGDAVRPSCWSLTMPWRASRRWRPSVLLDLQRSMVFQPSGLAFMPGRRIWHAAHLLICTTAFILFIAVARCARRPSTSWRRWVC